MRPKVSDTALSVRSALSQHAPLLHALQKTITPVMEADVTTDRLGANHRLLSQATPLGGGPIDAPLPNKAAFDGGEAHHYPHTKEPQALPLRSQHNSDKTTHRRLAEV